MTILCCGDRNWNNWSLVWGTLRGCGEGTVIVEGEARGADKMCRFVAEKLGYPVKPYPADWTKHGKAAGPIRNREMFNKEQPALVLAFHNDIDNSRGTKDMVNYARSRGCPVNIISEDL